MGLVHKKEWPLLVTFSPTPQAHRRIQGLEGKSLCLCVVSHLITRTSLDCHEN